MEDFNLAKELSVKQVWKKPEVVETDEYGACSSKSDCSTSRSASSIKSVIQSINLPNEPTLSNVTPEVLDDAVIAQLLQAEFDLEFDTELKRLESSRNKSKRRLV